MNYYLYKGTTDFWFHGKPIAKPDEILRISDDLLLTECGVEVRENLKELMERISPYLMEFKDATIEPRKLNSESVSISRVDHPTYYQNNASGIECIDVIEDFDFCTGNAIKYLWRCGKKKESGMDDKEKQIEDLKKAIWYIERKLKKLQQ